MSSTIKRYSVSRKHLKVLRGKFSAEIPEKDFIEKSEPLKWKMTFDYFRILVVTRTI